MTHTSFALRRPPLYGAERWQAYCKECGWFGPVCDNKPDAESAARRHSQTPQEQATEAYKAALARADEAFSNAKGVSWHEATRAWTAAKLAAEAEYRKAVAK